METAIGILIILGALVYLGRSVSKLLGVTSLKLPNAGQLGAIAASSKNGPILWMAVIAAILGTAIWWQWDALVSLHNEWIGPSFPMWGYAIILAVPIIAIWIFRMDKDALAKSSELATPLIIIAGACGALMIYYSWQKEDALCPDKQVSTSVPATGMVIELQSCWDEPFVTLDLRRVGVTTIRFDRESAVLEGRTVDEFARLETGRPGSVDGQAHLVFNSAEMRRYGMPSLPIFVGPSGYQAGANPRFSKEELQALAQ